MKRVDRFPGNRKITGNFASNIHNKKVIIFPDNGLMGWGIRLRIGRFLVQTPLGTQPGLWTQPCNKASIH